MSIEKIVLSIDEHFTFSEEEKSELTKRSSERKVLQKQFILQQGDQCNYLSFVIHGCFKMFSVDDNGKEHILSFFMENDWVADLESFYKKSRSQLNIQSIGASLILQFHRNDVYYLFKNSLNFNRIIRVMVENKYMEMQSRVLENIRATADERYVSFLTRYPDLANRIPNTYIASYLGITPEFLSKIRKNLSSGS